MSLLNVRKMVIKQSGRLDLAGSSRVLGTDGNTYECILSHTSANGNKPITGGTYTTYWRSLGIVTDYPGDVWVEDTDYSQLNYYYDLGIDDIINEAIKGLDIAQETSKSYAWYSEDITAGDYQSTNQYIRVLQELVIEDSDGVETSLEKVSYNELRILYPKLSATDEGTPAYFSTYPVTKAPNQVDDGTAPEYLGVIFLPPTDTSYTLKIYGLFHSATLSNNDDENYWTYWYPGVLVKETLKRIEVYNRNMTGVRDYQAAISQDLLGIDRDVADGDLDELHMKG